MPKIKNAVLFEVSWEVCNKVGGIHTVLRSKIAQAVAASKAVSIVGGGDTVAAVHKAGVADRISHISTGGGASLEYLAYETLPGIEALES